MGTFLIKYKCSAPVGYTCLSLVFGLSVARESINCLVKPVLGSIGTGLITFPCFSREHWDIVGGRIQTLACKLMPLQLMPG